MAVSFSLIHGKIVLFVCFIFYLMFVGISFIDLTLAFWEELKDYVTIVVKTGRIRKTS